MACVYKYTVLGCCSVVYEMDLYWDSNLWYTYISKQEHYTFTF